MRSEAVAVAHQFSAMQRPLWKPAKLRGLWRLLTLLALPPRLSLGDSPVLLSCDPPEQLNNGFITPHINAYGKGSVIRYYCNIGFKLIGSHVRKCMADKDSAWWNATSPQCQRFFCAEPPSISNGYFTGSATRYIYGSVVTYHCNNGFSLTGIPTISCDHDDHIGEFWNGNIPKCKVIFMETNETLLQSRGVVLCENPVVERGIQISGFSSTYTLGSTVAFECVFGYFMVGSYLIRCNEDSLWNPEVPTCRRINPDVCGAPLIPTGSVNPLYKQYNRGAEVDVLCNPQQCFPDETIEMHTVCQGYNFWEPPVQPCFLRTSPDISNLRILNGMIIEKKKHYVPGDNVTIQCYAGYSLRGPTTIRYIGGNKWLPTIPSCTLGFFFILLILGM